MQVKAQGNNTSSKIHEVPSVNMCKQVTDQARIKMANNYKHDKVVCYQAYSAYSAKSK